jgi:MFS family permease
VDAVVGAMLALPINVDTGFAGLALARPYHPRSNGKSREEELLMLTTRLNKTAHQVTAVRQMLPIISASTLGTAIEWFDFFFYGFLAVTVFPAVFFPTFNPFVGILAAFSSNFVGFVARPLGGAFFGWFGDRVGRKATLAVTLLLMGSATMLIGILPGYAAIGITAPLLLSLLRFVQGIGIGGEWGGSVLLSLEYGDDRHRGFWTSWPQTGVPIGLALSALSILLFKSLFPGEAFASIGWRIPFLQSSILLIVGLYIRLRIQETPAFAKVQREQRIAKAPLYEVLRFHWREVLLCMLVRSGETAPFYIFSTFVVTYAIQVAQVNTTMLYTGLLLGSSMALVMMPVFALISDHVGRERWFAFGTILMAVFVVPYFLLLQTKNPALIICDIIFSIGICISWLYGPEAALIAERFSTRLRYSGASLGYQLASITAGGSAPIIAAYLLANDKVITGNLVFPVPAYLLIALYLIIMSAISLIAVLTLRKYAYNDEAKLSRQT